MKFYKVIFDGLWMGGTAIVQAKDKRQARSIVRKAIKEDTTPRVREIREIEEVGPPLLYYDNGDY